MKKILKSKMFAIFVTAIFVASGTLYAANKYQASEVVYNKKDGTSTNVNDALNELYSKVGNKGYYYYYVNGTAIYYNPVTGKKCEASEAVSTTGTKTGCMKWYIFNDDSESSTVNMILDHNTTARIAWNDGGKNITYEESNLKTEIDKLVSESKWKDTPRLISVEEINNIIGKIKNTNQYYYLDTLTQEKEIFSESKRSRYDYLYNNLNLCKTDDIDYGCTIEDNNIYTGYGNAGDGKVWAYWTSTIYETIGVWFVDRRGYLNFDNANNFNIGIRPVITISKSIIK